MGNTGLLSNPAGTVVVRATGQTWMRDGGTESGKWLDWVRVVDADGWTLRPLQRWNRVPGAAFFCLCGCVGDNDRHAFAIGAELDWRVRDWVADLPQPRLKFFANDWRCMYFNNHELPPEQGGPLTTSITRLA